MFLGTVQELPSDRGQFDAVIGMGVMDYLGNEPQTLEDIFKLLKPGGLCLLSYTNAGTILRWIELPIKRAVALAGYLVTGRTAYRDVAWQTSAGHTSAQVSALSHRAGFNIEVVAYFSYGIRMKSFWLPPLSMVKKLDGLLRPSVFRALGRGFMVMGRRPR